MARIVLALVIIALSIYTLIDCAGTPAHAMPARLPKVVWILLVLLVPIIGPGIWLLLKHRDALTSDTPITASDISDKLRGKSPQPAAPVAPDDDPDFLARLDALNRRKAYEARKAEEDKAAGRPEKKPDTDDDEPTGLYS